ncbi:MAG: DUF2760 domain-containing protein [bacterium]|nr:DUF2760 domain-containing protein [bacterium]
MNLSQFLSNIGSNLPGFKNGLISGIVLIVAVLIIFYIIKLIFCRGKKSASVIDTAKLDEYENRIKTLSREVESVKQLSKKSFADGSVYGLALLQREGRLVDFLKEDIKNFEDAQIGAAVRQIHAGCSKVLDENYSVKPLVDTVKEGENLALEDNFDASEYRLTGNIPKNAPYKGIVRHKGWIASEVNLPKRIGQINPNVVSPAEVEF